MKDDLCILCPDPVYSQQSGGVLRTYNIAKLGSNIFCKVSILAVDEKVIYGGEKDGINIIQSKKYKNRFDKLKYYLEGAFSSNFSLRSPDLSPYINGKTLFQIEGPYFYNTLKKNNIANYILNEHNVYWEFSNFPTFGIKNFVYYKQTFKRNKKLEIQALRDAAHVLVCSERDAQLLIREVPAVKNKFTVIPNCINFEDYKMFLEDYSKVPEEYKKTVILFIGNLLYPPNYDAVSIICSQIAPDFGEDVEFVIVGKNPPNLPKPSNVTFMGYVDDIKESIQNSEICIAPLRYGSGTRLKILEYMAMGKPVISTSKGAEGINFTNNKNIIIEDDIDAFSEKIQILLDDKKMRDNLGKNAQDLIKREYDWEIYRKTLHDVYESCM